MSDEHDSSPLKGLDALDGSRPHDALFKFTFSKPRHAEAELRTLLPAEIVAIVDFTQLEVVPGEFIDEELRGSQSDLLIKLPLRGDGEPESLFVHLIFEHQSSFEPWLPLRMLKYMVRVLDRVRRDAPREHRVPPVLPLVLYHGDRGFQPIVRFASMYALSDAQRAILGPYLLDFEIRVDDLTSQTSQALARRTDANAFVRLVLFMLQRARRAEDLLLELSGWFDTLQALEHEAELNDDAATLFWYAYLVADVLPSNIRDILEEARTPTLKDLAMTTAERLRREGYAEGEAKGKAEGEAKGKAEGEAKGKAEGRAETLLKLLALRFGSVPDGVLTKIESAARRADLAPLDRWVERVLSAPRAEDVVADD